MSNKFDPKNKIIGLCMIGMNMEEQGDPERAMTVFMEALNESANDYEKFVVTYQIAKYEKNIQKKLKWLEKTLQYAIKSEDCGVRSTLSTIYHCIARCYEESGDSKKAKVNFELSDLYNTEPKDQGPFYHGTRADLQTGDFLVAGKNSNYKTEIKMNHIYFTSNINGAILAAGLAKGEGKERIYIVEPTGQFENDPNVTDKKFPGNLTCSYRSTYPLKIIGEEINFTNQTDEELSQWKEKVADNKGEIIN